MRPPLPAPDRLRTLLARLESGLLEREAPARLALLAALAGEHLLLIGPPGTAKSALARRLHRAFAGAPYFERLLTRFSTPEELFGPLSLKALEEDRYERLTAGFLPEAGIAFLDEVFKANSAILNTLLTLLNEREFDNGSARRRTPLVCVVGASNETPADEALSAFHDRFLLRVPVAPVGDANFEALLTLPDGPETARGPHAALGPDAPDDDAAAPVTAVERAALAEAAAEVELGPEALAACRALRAWLATRSAPLSDRRWRQWLRLMRVAAAAEGRGTLDALDLWLAPYVAAPTPDDVPALQDWVDAELARALPQPAPWLARAVEAFERQLEIERSMPADQGDGDAGKLALARAIGGGEAADAAPLRIVSARLEERLRRRWSPVHVAARVAQVDEVIADAQSRRAATGQARDALAARLAGRLWLPPTRAARWLGGHAATLAVLDALLARLAATRAGFAALPVDEALPADAPVPVAMPG